MLRVLLLEKKVLLVNMQFTLSEKQQKQVSDYQHMWEMQPLNLYRNVKCESDNLVLEIYDSLFFMMVHMTIVIIGD
jgi:hypothetical protein